MKRIFNRKSKQLLVIRGGLIGSWSADITVVNRKGDSAAVFYEGDAVFFEGDEGGDGYFRGWIGDVSKADMLRELARILRTLPHEMAFSIDNISSESFDQWAIDYLIMCFEPKTSQDAALAEFLTCFPTHEIHLVFNLFNGFNDHALITLAESVYELGNREPSETRIYEELVRRCGPVTQISWFKDAAEYVRQELESARSLAEGRNTELRLEQERLYGKAEEVADAEGLLAKFGQDIPAGYLSHATLFSPPQSLYTAASLLEIWGGIEQPLPNPPPSTDGATCRSSWFSADIIFLKWLMQERQSRLLDLAKRLSENTRDKLFAKLMRYANQGAIDLANLEKEKAVSQAQYIFLQIKRSQAEFAASLAPEAHPTP